MAQVGQQTGISEALITALDGNDYSAYGSDSRARSYIRRIAGAVGADPEPLNQGVQQANHGRCQPPMTEPIRSTPRRASGARSPPGPGVGLHPTSRGVDGDAE